MEKNKKKKIISIVIIAVVVIAISMVLVIFVNKHPKELTNNLSNGELLGEERVKVQEEIIGIINKYIDENMQSIKEYLNAKNERTISMEELEKELKVDINKFKKLKYGCDSKFTTIDFNVDYSEHVITITCKALYKK